ncbi:hypothetical protein NDU88_003647 [Pleurodeles waltl]|uniref:Uncharacterized protein n=1 Tax=Pleurodeles waltl TaxID=8319 RepID=A0AAV7SGK0_PLEWA|nr:hypothetical protein NDU88_003647 [Pleurodeles waltl]
MRASSSRPAEGRAAPVKVLPRQGIRRSSSKSSIPRRPHSRSRPGAEAFQPRRSRDGGRHLRGSSHGGGGPSDRRKQPRPEGSRGGYRQSNQAAPGGQATPGPGSRIRRPWAPATPPFLCPRRLLRGTDSGHVGLCRVPLHRGGGPCYDATNNKGHSRGQDSCRLAGRERSS